jgi:outer membrane protein assembly factor BamB
VSVAWERDLGASEVNATPTLAGGTLYVGDGSPVADSGTAYALDPLTGETRWSESFDGPVLEGPTVAGGVVYVAAGGRIAGFREDGSLVWDFENQSAENYTAVTREGDDIYYGADSGRLYKFAALSKLKKWDPRLFGAISAAPIVEDGTVYVAARDGTVQARSSGSEADWNQGLGDAVNGLAKRDGRLYAPSEEGRLVQLNERGNVVWSQSTPGAAAATPAVTEETVYVGTRDDALVAYSTEDAVEEWRFTDAENGFTAPPVVADGTVYVGCRDNRVYALDAETGEPEWTFETGDNIEQVAPVVAGGFVFIGSQDGTLYALSD